MKTIKVYCSAEEKKRIQEIAQKEGLTVSKHLLRSSLSDLPERAMLAQLVSAMVQPMPSQVLRKALLEIAQEVLEGGSIAAARARIVEVCTDADQGSQGQ